MTTTSALKRQGRLHPLSPETERLFDLVSEDVCQLWWDVQLYLGLYSEHAVPILQRRTAATFRMIQRRLYDANYLTICCLMDPPATMRRARRSVSFASLIKAVRDEGEVEVANEMNAHRTAIEKLCPDIDAWRDQLIAHSDLAARDGTLTVPPRVEFDVVLKIAIECADLMNVYAGLIRDTTIFYDRSPMGVGSPQELLDALEIAEFFRNPNLRGIPSSWISSTMRAALERAKLFPREE